jgi:hypothetical protein
VHVGVLDVRELVTWKRPAESAGAAGGGLVAVLIAVGIPQGIAAGAVLAAGAVPAIVTWLVSHGGVRGALRALWDGRKSSE